MRRVHCRDSPEHKHSAAVESHVEAQVLSEVPGGDHGTVGLQTLAGQHYGGAPINFRAVGKLEHQYDEPEVYGVDRHHQLRNIQRKVEQVVEVPDNGHHRPVDACGANAASVGSG